MFAEFAKKLNKAKKWCALGVVVAFFALPATVHANAQFTPAELDTLVSTIALYPDPLLVQVLAASVHGDEIPGASDWANQHKNLKGEELAERIRLEELPYDESVQALIPFPTVLATMAKYQEGTGSIGGWDKSEMKQKGNLKLYEDCSTDRRVCRDRERICL